MIKSVRVIVFILIALFGWNFPVTLHAAQGQSPTYVPDEVIVKYRDSVDEFKKEIGRVRVAGQRKRQFKLVRGLEVIKLGRNVSVAEAIDLLKQDPDVLYAEPNYRIFLTGNPNINLTPNDPSMGSLWGLTKINAPGAWNNSTGSANVAVGILDTGFDYTHGDLSANIFNNPAECVANGADNDGNGYEDDCHGIDVVNGDTDPIDDNGHGTHVAGTIGAVGNNGTGVVGVNWNVKMLSCKVFDANGSGSTDDAVLCLEYFEFMKVNRGVNIIATNNSWGGGDYSQALYDAIDAQREAGILFIAAAGNGNEFGIGQNNDSIPLYPCNYFVANMICVAATTSNDGKASFSNFGRRTVHVGAPGQNILSTVPGGYSSSNGTSMATPHVTGLAALLKAQDSNRDWRAIKNLILAGGNTVSSMANTITGRRINALGSMTCSNTAIQTRLQPIATTISASPGVPVVLASLNINCATPNGNVSVSVSSGGTVTLLDGGANGDQAAGDGIYSALWTPSATGTYTLTFPGNDRVTVNVANPTISVTPTSLSFDGVSVGSSSDKNFTVTNSGGGVLSGSASTSAPYSIVSGASYNLSAGQSQTVTVRFTPTAVETFLTNVTFTGAAGATRQVSGSGVGLSSIAPNPTDLAAVPASFTINGNGFANLGFGLSVVNFNLGSTLIAQARATSGTSTSLTVPYPTNATSLSGPLPGLSAGTVTVYVYNQTASSSWSLLGSTSLTVNDTRPAPPVPGVSSITPNPIDLASAPSNFTIAGGGFTNSGFGLPLVNFNLGSTLIGQARATAGTSTSLTVPYPTNATSLSGPLAGLSAGTVTVQVYNQTASSSWSLLGSTSLTVNDTRPAPPVPGVSSIAPNPIDLASAPSNFTIAGGGFTNSGFGLPLVNFYHGGTFVGQARATSGTSTSLTVPYPTNATSLSGPLPGLSAGTVTVYVYNQTASSSWSLLGSTSLTVNDTRPAPPVPGVSSITPNPIDLASAPSNFTIAGGGFTNSGFGLPLVNFYHGGTFVGQARATSGTSTSLTVPYPTNATSLSGPLPGLSAGTVTVYVYNQTASSSWSLLGSTSLTVNDTRPAPPVPGVSSITPNPIDLASAPSNFTIAGGGFTNSGFGLPLVNFNLGSTLIGQARATAGTSTSLTVPYPTNATSLSGPLAGLSAGTVTVQVYNQTSSSSWSLLGSTSLTVNDTR